MGTQKQGTAGMAADEATAAASAARHVRAALLVALGMLMLAVTPTALNAQTVAVITSPDRSGIDINRPLLLALFTMRVRQWPDGEPAQVFVLPDGSDIHEGFCREQLGTYPYVLRGAWDRMVYTGTGLAPTIVRSEEEMREKVRSTKGAIGYLRLPAQPEAAPGRRTANPSSATSP